MTKQILRVAAGGILAGTLIYFFPFILLILGIFLLIGITMRLIFGSGNKWSRHQFQERIKNLSEEERKVFFEKYGHGCYAKEMYKAEVKVENNNI